MADTSFDKWSIDDPDERAIAYSQHDQSLAEATETLRDAKSWIVITNRVLDSEGHNELSLISSLEGNDEQVAGMYIETFHALLGGLSKTLGLSYIESLAFISWQLAGLNPEE